MNLTTGPVFTAIIEREGNLYVALCPELDVASQGTSIENALENLKEAVALFIETADPGEMKERRREHVFVTQFPGRGWVGSASSPDARPVRYSCSTASAVTVPVPNHPELAIGTLLAIIRQSRVPRAAFETSQ